jgi:putative ABC transport system ATP-binding protein
MVNGKMRNGDASMTEPVLSCTALSKTYTSGGGVVNAVSEVDLEMRKGDFIAITGPSGSGKTTLLSMLGGLEKPSSGDLFADGEPVSKKFGDLSDYRREQIGFVFQGYNLVPHLTAMENVLLPMELAGVKRSERRARAVELLTSVGIRAERYGHKPSRLSGGEQQRVAIARALANTPPVLLADEPTGNLDKANAVQVIGLLKRMAKNGGLCVVLVTHNEKIAQEADRVVALNYGCVEVSPASGW